MKNTIITIIVGLMAVVIIAQHCAIKAPSRTLSGQTVVDIPSIRQIQQRLNATGKKRYYCGIIDGKYGAKTRRALENYICDKFAIQTFKPEYYIDDHSF